MDLQLDKRDRMIDSQNLHRKISSEIKHIKKMQGKSDFIRSMRLYREKKQNRQKQLVNQDPLKLTSELEDIVKAISNLEKQERGVTYHQGRKQKLQSFMQSVKKGEIRSSLSTIQRRERFGEKGSLGIDRGDSKNEFSKD